MRLIIFGPPGVGKGTVTGMLLKEENLVHIATGDMLREAIDQQTPTGLKAKEYMDKGELVPDEVVVELLKQRLEGEDSNTGFVLDGFPRDTKQAHILEDEGISIDFVLQLSAPDETVVQRISSRRICESCKSVYNLLTMQPERDGICDHCGGNLIQRDDDREEAVRHRLRVYGEKTAPLIDYYKEKGMLLQVDASVNDPHQVFERVKEKLREAYGTS